MSRPDRNRIVGRIITWIDCKSNHGAWQSQGMALIGHRRSRTFGREATARHLTWIRTSSRRGTTSGLATWRAVFCYAKSPQPVARGCRISPSDAGMPKANDTLRYRYETNTKPTRYARQVASLRQLTHSLNVCTTHSLTQWIKM